MQLKLLCNAIPILVLVFAYHSVKVQPAKTYLSYRASNYFLFIGKSILKAKQKSVKVNQNTLKVKENTLNVKENSLSQTE